MNSMFGGTGVGAALRGPTGAGGQMNATGFYKEKIPKGYKAGKIQQFTPEQIQLFQSLFGHVGPESYLSRLAGGEPGLFEEMEAPAMRQFQELQGGLASRFSGMGGGGRQQALSSQRSSGFQNIMGQQASNFAQDLAARRQALQQQAIMDLMGISRNLLGQRPYERALVEKPKPFWQQLLIGAAPGLGHAAGQAMFGGGEGGGAGLAAAFAGG